MTQFAFPLSNDGILFAYVFQGHPGAGNDGWRVYQPEVEYQRQVRASVLDYTRRVYK